MTETQLKKVSDIIFDEKLYPRLFRDPKLVDKYVENIEVLPAIEVNQDLKLIDGWHRLNAYKNLKIENIPVVITKTISDEEFLALTIQRNASHGMQLSNDDKKTMALRLFNSGKGCDEETIAKILSVSKRSVRSYLKNIKNILSEEQNKVIFDMHMASYTHEEIAEKVNLDRVTITDRLKLLSDLDRFPKPTKLFALYQDADWKPELFNVWNFNNDAVAFENLLYAFTEPYDIVVDPFAGGGITIDVCKKRMRRIYAFNSMPKPSHTHEIRTYDIKDGLPLLNKNWSNVSLTYLDPPKDVSDTTIINFINKLMEKQSKGGISLMMRLNTIDRVINICREVVNDKFNLINRILYPCPNFYDPRKIRKAEEEKTLINIRREILVWKHI